MPQSKIKEFHPMITNGEQEVYRNDRGTYYKFWIEFEDGTKGQVLSTSTSPKWKVGNTYNFELTDKGGVKGMKEVEAKSNATTSIWNDPEVIRKKCQQACMKMAAEFIIEHVDQQVVEKGHVFKYAKTFYDWCIKTDNDKYIWDRMAALESAIKIMHIKAERIGTSVELMSLAETINEWKP